MRGHQEVSEGKRIRHYSMLTSTQSDRENFHGYYEILVLDYLDYLGAVGRDFSLHLFQGIILCVCFHFG